MYQWLVRPGTEGYRHEFGCREYNGDSLSRRMAKGMIRPLRMGKYLAGKGFEQRELGSEELRRRTGNSGYIPHDVSHLQ